MRLNKFISDSGECSRREADERIAAGRVSVNGEVAAVGANIVEGDQVLMDGQPLRQRRVSGGRRHVYIAFHKPAGVTCTTDTEIKGNIIDFIGHQQRIFPIGRLDKESEGLILLTSNGDIVNEILRAENAKEKEYLVAVNREVDDAFLRGMARGGIVMHGQRTRPCRATRLGKLGFRIVLTQGLNRQIRLMATHFGYRVKRLVRTRIVNISLGRLKIGQWRNLTDAELRGLLPTRSEW
jgi:23S rRNA pseudouridine2604 synthase